MMIEYDIIRLGHNYSQYETGAAVQMCLLLLDLHCEIENAHSIGIDQFFCRV